eukprot:1541205-Amphidinium_carterae.1
MMTTRPASKHGSELRSCARSATLFVGGGCSICKDSTAAFSGAAGLDRQILGRLHVQLQLKVVLSLPMGKLG